MSLRSDTSLLADLLAHAERIAALYAERGSPAAFHQDRTARESVLWNFIVMGEVCGRLGDAFRSEHPEVPWRSIVSQRNVIAHGYDIID